MKNNNARINDFLKACKREGYLMDFHSGQTQRSIRQWVKQNVSDTTVVSVHFVDGFAVHLTIPLHKSRAENLPPDLAEDFAILTRQPSKEAIETESEIIKGCTLLGAKHLGEGKLRTACGVTYRIPLDKPVKAQQVRDAVIYDLSQEIKKKPQIFLTRPIPTPQ